jgi:hypothetical protein
MKAKIMFVFVLALSSSMMYPQNNINSFLISVNITSCQINFIDTVFSSNARGNSRGNLVMNMHYYCKFTICWNSDTAVVDEPFEVNCYLPDNRVVNMTLNSRRDIMMSGKYYDFGFDIYSVTKLTGSATLELSKCENDAEDNYRQKKYIRFDRATVFIN